MAENRYRRYTETELNHIRTHSTWTARELAAALGRTKGSIQKTRLRYGFPFKKRQKVLSTWVSTLISNQEIEEIERLVKDGKYSSRGALVRAAAKIVLAIEDNNREKILSEARIDAQKKLGLE